MTQQRTSPTMQQRFADRVGTLNTCLQRPHTPYTMQDGSPVSNPGHLCVVKAPVGGYRLEEMGERGTSRDVTATMGGPQLLAVMDAMIWALKAPIGEEGDQYGGGTGINASTPEIITDPEAF